MPLMSWLVGRKREGEGREPGGRIALQGLLTQIIMSSFVQVRQYVFAGELQQGGELSAMRLRVPQARLPAAITDAILVELDVQSRVGRLVLCLPSSYRCYFFF